MASTVLEEQIKSADDQAGENAERTFVVKVETG